MKIKNKPLWFAIIAGDFIIFAVVAIMFIHNAKKEKAKDTPAPPQAQTVNIYFYDSSMSRLVPHAIKGEQTSAEERARTSLKTLLSGPPGNSPLSATFPDDVKVKEVRVQGGTATVDFNKNLLKPYGATMEIGMAGSLVLTLTDIPGIQKVQILCEGKKIPYLPEGTEIGNPLTRSDFSQYEHKDEKI